MTEIMAEKTTKKPNLNSLKTRAVSGIAGMAGMSAVGLAALLLVSGCKSEPENLASQIGPITAMLGPNVDGQGNPIQEVRYTFKNNGPKAVGAVFARTDVYDAAGNRTGDTTERYCIFGSTSPADRLKPGQTYQTAAGHGYLLLRGPAVRATVSPVEAFEKSDIETATEEASKTK